MLMSIVASIVTVIISVIMSSINGLIRSSVVCIIIIMICDIARGRAGRLGTSLSPGGGQRKAVSDGTKHAPMSTCTDE